MSFKDQHGCWRERVVQGGKKDAEAYLRRVLSEVSPGTFGVQEEDSTLSQFYARWMAAKEKT